MPRPRVYQREGIVLRQLDYGEADRILTIITPEGKVRAMAKGIRRAVSRKAGHLGLFTRSQMMLAQGRNLDIVTQAQSLEEFEGIRGDLERFYYASYVGELADRISQEEEENRGLYTFFLTALRWLNEERDLALGTRLFEVRLLGASGFQPTLFTCVACGGATREETNYLNAELGGILCPRCGREQPGSVAVSVNAQKVLRYLQRHNVDDIRRLRVGASTHAELEALLLPYLEYTFEREFRTAAYLRRMRDELAGRRPPEASVAGAGSR